MPIPRGKGTLAVMETVHDRIYRVSELTDEIRNLLEGSFPFLAVQGEISNFRPSGAGHLYFTLKDREAMISAVMFRSRAQKLGFIPQDGKLVTARGNLSVYAQRGSYQIVCESLEPAGEGAILAMLEERKRRLAAEGLFDPSRKKPLPAHPRRVGVVTSPTGAAVRDILKVLGRRHAGIHVIILPAPVQGDEAEELIAAQIRRANRHRLADVLIVGRGGGSLEDLLAFSGEAVVRAIADSKIPVISAVGHEIDTSLSDLAADFRAPTPSAAAEAVSGERDELLRHVRELSHALSDFLNHRIERVRLLLDRFTPENLEQRFRMLLQPGLLRLDDAKERLVENIRSLSLGIRRRLDISTARIESCSPFDVLKRGYAIVKNAKTGRVVVSASTLAAGDDLSIRFHEGEAHATVEKTSGTG